MQVRVCQHCGRQTDDLRPASVSGTIIMLCDRCYDKLQPPEHKMEKSVMFLFPELVMIHSPLASFIMRAPAKEAILPLGISVKKEQGEKEEGEVQMVSKEEIDWDILVGSEPVDELKGKGIAHVLAAKFAEDNAVVTAKELANYLAEMARNPELEEYLMKFKDVNEDAARHVLNELAEMGIVKKEAGKGKRGANLYDYFAAERSWRKEGY